MLPNRAHGVCASWRYFASRRNGPRLRRSRTLGAQQLHADMQFVRYSAAAQCEHAHGGVGMAINNKIGSVSRRNVLRIDVGHIVSRSA
jgi:hypothetical protein